MSAAVPIIAKLTRPAAIVSLISISIYSSNRYKKEKAEPIGGPHRPIVFPLSPAPVATAVAPTTVVAPGNAVSSSSGTTFAQSYIQNLHDTIENEHPITAFYRGISPNSSKYISWINKEMPTSEIFSVLKREGFSIIKNNGTYILRPEYAAAAAERSAARVVAAAQQQINDIPRKIVTREIGFSSIINYYRRMVNAKRSAELNARHLHSDGQQLFNACFDYLLIVKTMEAAGFLAYTGVAKLAYNKWLASPAERVLGPAFASVTRVATVPFRAVVTPAVAKEFGLALARRSPLALFMMVQWYGFLYTTERDFAQFLYDFSRNYPELSKQIAVDLQNSARPAV